jgi:hypothetical protein
MKHFSLILALIFSIFCKGQDYKQFYSKEFEWRLNIPDDFESVSKQKDKQFASEGKKALEKTVGAEIEDNSKQIFLYTKNRTNYIMSNWQEFDEKKDGKYLSSVKFVNETIFKTFQNQFPEVSIDSTSTSEIISNKEFHVFHVTIPIANTKAKMNMYVFSHLFEKKDFNVYVVFIDKIIGEELLKNLRSSTFGI